MRRSFLALATLVPTLLAAQGGASSTWSLHGTLPDTVQKASRGMLSSIDLRLTMATDGKRFSFLMQPGPNMIASSLAMDLSTVQLKMLSTTTDDSIHIGLVLPPDLANQMGGGIGLQMAISLPDSLIARMIPDSLKQSIAKDAAESKRPDIRDSGTTDTVAGLSCRVWIVTPPSSPPGDTVELCLTAKTAALTAVQDAMKGRFASLTSEFEKMATGANAPGWPTDQFAIRFRIRGSSDLTFELLSVTEGPPPASAFTLPEGLTPFDPGILQGMMGGMQGSPEG